MKWIFLGVAADTRDQVKRFRDREGFESYNSTVKHLLAEADAHGGDSER